MPIYGAWMPPANSTAPRSASGRPTAIASSSAAQHSSRTPSTPPMRFQRDEYDGTEYAALPVCTKSVVEQRHSHCTGQGRSVTVTNRSRCIKMNHSLWDPARQPYLQRDRCTAAPSQRPTVPGAMRRGGSQSAAAHLADGALPRLMIGGATGPLSRWQSRLVKWCICVTRVAHISFAD
jgi:hypothetical protein